MNKLGALKGMAVAAAVLAPGAVSIWGCLGEQPEMPAQLNILPPITDEAVTARSIVGTWSSVDADEPSEIEFEKGGAFVSRVAGDEVLRAAYVATPVDDAMLMVDMKIGRGIKTTLVDVARDHLVIHDPERGELVFRRTR